MENLTAGQQEFLYQKRLSLREKQVVDVLMEGLSNAEIAEKLGVKEKAVKSSCTALFKKLNVTSRFKVMVLMHKVMFDTYV